jgi:hypothetical protein
VSPLILAEHDSLHFFRLRGMWLQATHRYPYDAFLSMTGTIFASCPAQGAIVCRAVCNQAMLEPALEWVEHVPGIEVNADLLQLPPVFSTDLL